MAGYVTTTRLSLKNPLCPFSVTGFGNTVSGPDYLATYLPSIRGSETTTSWRSVSKAVDDELQNLDSATNELQAVQAIARDTKEFSNSYDRGHTFSKVENWGKWGIPRFVYNNSSNGNRHDGPLIASPTFMSTSVYPSTPSPFSDLNYYGSKAIGGTIPSNPLTNLGVTLGEIYSDGLPHLPGFLGLAAKGFGALKHLGEEYLNYQFGWKPTVADTVSAMSAVDRANNAIKQFMKDNGKTIRRSFSFPEEKSSTIYPDRRAIPYDPGQAFSGDFISFGTTTETVLTRRNIWFKGAYSYYIPIGKDQMDTMERYAALAQKVSGLEITPEVLWQLAPWSWFGGWLSDLGSLVHNIQAFSEDGLVLRYGYLMVTTESIHTVTTRGMVLRNGNISVPPWTDTYRTIRKERFKATPYGFGLNPNSFTGSQWSILGALGISRSPGSLRN